MKLAERAFAISHFIPHPPHPSHQPHSAHVLLQVAWVHFSVPASLYCALVSTEISHTELMCVVCVRV